MAFIVSAAAVIDIEIGIQSKIQLSLGISIRYGSILAEL